MTFAEDAAAEDEENRQFARRIVLAKTPHERARILSEKHSTPDETREGSSKRVGIGGISHGADARLRPLNKGAVRDLAKSMSKIGMLNPITVKNRRPNGYELICGLHRLEAAKLLGWPAVPVIVIDGPAGDLELAQIDENLRREELTPIERAFHLARAKELYEAKNPNATARSIQSRHAHELNGKVPGCTAEAKPYRKVAAAELGVKPLAIDESVRFSKIPNVRLAVGTCLDGAPQLRPLHRLRKSDPGKVQDLLSRANAGEKVSAIETSNAAEEFAAWIAKRATSIEMPTILTWLHAVAAKGVGVELRRLTA